MSYTALNWAWQADIPTGPKMVLVALADQAGYKEDTDQLLTVAGQERLAAMTSMSVRSVARHLAWLEDHNLISRTTRRRPDGFKTSDSTVLNVTIDASRLTLDNPTNHDETPTSLPESSVNLSGDTESGDRLSPDSGDDLTGQSCRPHLTQCPVLKEPPVEPLVEPLAQTTRQPPQTPSEKPSRGHRLPETFVVTDAMRSWAKTEWPWFDVDSETELFRDFWHAETGAKASKRDWVLAWKVWIRRSASRVPQWRRQETQPPATESSANSLRAPYREYTGDPDDLQAYQAWSDAEARRQKGLSA